MDLSSLNINSFNLGKNFTDHRVFNQLDDLISFYDALSYTTMDFVSLLPKTLHFNLPKTLYS